MEARKPSKESCWQEKGEVPLSLPAKRRREAANRPLQSPTKISTGSTNPREGDEAASRQGSVCGLIHTSSRYVWTAVLCIGTALLDSVVEVRHPVIGLGHYAAINLYAQEWWILHEEACEG